jgi:hypothetical protein
MINGTYKRALRLQPIPGRMSSDFSRNADLPVVILSSD